MKYIYGFLICAIVGVWGYILVKKYHVTDSTPSDPTTTALAPNNVRMLGKRHQFIPISQTFFLVNKGDKPLIVYDMRADCSCTVPSWNHKPVSPHDSMKVQVVYDAKRLGFFQKKVIVMSNNAAGDLLLVMKGETF